MENKISKILFNTNFVKRALSAFVIMPVMITPILLVVVMLTSVFIISKRESLEKLNNSLLNILNIDNLK